MIDMFALLVSVGLTALVVLQAIRLNRSMPWFTREKPARAEQGGAKPQAGRGPRYAPGRSGRAVFRR